MGWGTAIGIGLQLYSSSKARSAANKGAAQAVAIGNKNAEIIERDIDIAKRQIEILYENLRISNERKREGFKAVQGSVLNVSLGSGITSRGTPQEVLMKNATEFNYELAIDDYNTSIAVEEQEDLIEEAKLRAEISRMGGMAESSALRARGTQALLKGFSNAIGLADEEGWLG